MMEQTDCPQVSVIIPTKGRPELVVRAVNSALAQTFQSFEIVVVIDGADQTTEQTLNKIRDNRLKIYTLAQSVGGGEARNQGVKLSRGTWIAFLDDDDQWLPTKLAKQMALAVTSVFRYPVIASKLIYRAPRGDFVFPERFPRPDEHISEYILTRNSLFQGEGLIQTSMLLTRKELLEAVPFPQIKRHQEWAWVLDAAEVSGVGVEFVNEPLLIWYVEEKRDSISSQRNWRNSYNWANEYRGRITGRAYAAFLMTVVSSIAAKEKAWKAFAIILTSSLTKGSPQMIDLANFFGIWLVPQTYRHKIRRLLRR